MTRLGGNTKVYKSYGKRNLNTVNQGSRLAAKAWSSSTSSSPSSASSYKSAQSRATSLGADVDDDDDDKENKVDRARHGVKRAVPVAVTVVFDSDHDTDEEEQVIELSDSSVEIQVEQHRRQLGIQDSEDEDGDWSDNDDESEEAQSSVVLTSSLSTKSEPSWLADLLAVCTSAAVQSFDEFVSRPPRAVRGSALAVGDKEWHKVGEASFSEVFRTGDTVIKIVPLHDPAQQSAVRGDWPMLSEVDAVTREINIASAMSKVDGFVEFKGAYVVRGSFATALLDEWDDFKAERVRQKHPEAHLQARPDVLPATQHYALICLAYGGADLEAFRLRNWREAISVFIQVAQALMHAEERFQFEHRDLHWGNILIKEDDSLDIALDKLSLSPARRRKQGVKADRRLKVTLIDFTLSRMRCDDGQVLLDDLTDEALFEGEGDVQFDTYRMMRNASRNDWHAFHPTTNVMWLRYVAYKLLHDKGLVVPARVGPATTRATPRKRKTRAARESSAEDQAGRTEDRKAFEDLRAWSTRLDKAVAPFVAPLATSKRGRQVSRPISLRELLDDLGL